MRITPEEGLDLLRSDVRDAESCVHRYVKVPLTQGEFDALEARVTAIEARLDALENP